MIPNLSPLGHASLALWLLLCPLLFWRLPPHRAAMLLVTSGWLLLPNFTLTLRGLPDPSKLTMVPLAVLLTAVVFDPATIRRFRPTGWDLPMGVFCLAPLFTSLANGLGWYDGVSAAVEQGLRWGSAYWLGRLYLTTPARLQELAVTMALGGLVYLPLSWAELALGPRLHLWFYGYLAAPLGEAWRLGGWRPVVFLRHGLMTALWMAAATVSAFWLWRTQALARRWQLPMGVLALALGVTTVALKSVNGWLTLVLGIGLLWLTARTRARWPVTVLVGLILVYVLVRGTNLWGAEQLVAPLELVFGTERAASVQFRFENEERLVRHAQKQWLWGWGGWGRSTIRNHDWHRSAVPADSLWILMLSTYGWAGLGSILTALLLPSWMQAWRSAAAWGTPAAAGVAILSTVVLIYTVDNLLNAMTNPIYLLALGGLAGLSAGGTPPPLPQQGRGIAQGSV